MRNTTYENKLVNINESVTDAVKACKKRVRSPHAYLKVLGLYTRSNLLEDVCKMYKTAANTHIPNPSKTSEFKSIKPID
jgi:hypothetical protein